MFVRTDVNRNQQHIMYRSKELQIHCQQAIRCDPQEQGLRTFSVGGMLFSPKYAYSFWSFPTKINEVSFFTFSSLSKMSWGGVVGWGSDKSWHGHPGRFCKLLGLDDSKWPLFTLKWSLAVPLKRLWTKGHFSQILAPGPKDGSCYECFHVKPVITVQMYV